MFERQVNDIKRKTIDFMKNKLYLVNFLCINIKSKKIYTDHFIELWCKILIYF